MADVSVTQVKELRERTGAGMMDCKRALGESDGDIEAAIEALRAKGLAAAAKKGGRVAAEGLIGLVLEPGRGALVEFNAETDFVARNEVFQGLVRRLTELALRHEGDVEAVRAAPYPDTGHSAAEEITHQIATLGEKLDLRRTACLTVSPGVVAGYVHGALTPGLGRIGVLIALRSDADSEPLGALGHQIAMHIAAANPLAVTAAELDPAVVDQERRILREQSRQTGKTDEIIEKMVEGRLRKFYQDSVFMEQRYVIDPDQTVAQAIEAVASELGTSIEVSGFIRYSRGEGIERKDADFAAEVAAQVGR